MRVNVVMNNEFVLLRGVVSGSEGRICKDLISPNSRQKEKIDVVQ